MNHSFLFMNWVLDLHAQSSVNIDVMFLRNSLTNELWEQFINSDSAIALTQSFVDSIKHKVSIPKKPLPHAMEVKPKKSRVKKTLLTEIPNTLLDENQSLEEIPKTKKSRVKKTQQVIVEVPDTLLDENEVGVKTKKPRVKKNKPIGSQEISLQLPYNDIIVGDNLDDFQEIQLQLVSIDGKDSFIDTNRSLFI